MSAWYNGPARTAEQIDEQVTAERENDRRRFAAEDAARANGEACSNRREAQIARQRADEINALAFNDPDSLLHEEAKRLRAKADELDPPTEKPKVVRDSLHMWFVKEMSDGTSQLSTHTVVAEPSREFVHAIWMLVEEFGRRKQVTGQHVYWDRTRTQVLRRLVFSGLTHAIGCSVYNSRGTPEGKIWAEAMAMFEKWRDSDFP